MNVDTPEPSDERPMMTHRRSIAESAAGEPAAMGAEAVGMPDMSTP